MEGAEFGSSLLATAVVRSIVNIKILIRAVLMKLVTFSIFPTVNKSQENAKFNHVFDKNKYVIKFFIKSKSFP